MKKYSFALCLFLIWSVSLYASKKDSVNYKNEVGIVVTDLIDGSFQFTYERVVRPHITVKIGYAYKGKTDW